MGNQSVAPLVALAALFLLLCGQTTHAVPIEGTEPGCLDTGGPTPETFCTSGFSASVSGEGTWAFQVEFANMTHIETLKRGKIEVNLLASSASGDPFDLSGTGAYSNFSLVLNEMGGTPIPVSFSGGIGPALDSLRFFSDAAVDPGLYIHGFDFSMTCTITNGVDVCAEQRTFSLIVIEIENTAGGVQAGVWSVPEPTTLALMTLGMAGVGYGRKRKA